MRSRQRCSKKGISAGGSQRKDLLGLEVNEQFTAMRNIDVKAIELTLVVAALGLSWAFVPLLAEEPAKIKAVQEDAKEWQSLFDGKSLEGWDAEDHKECFKAQDGCIVAGGGPLARLSYVGPVNKHDFKNFELKVEVLAKPGSNGGVFFHTGPQSKFLKKGYEAQVCNSCGDKRQTGSLLVVEDFANSPVKDDEWFEYHILVSGKRIVIKVNGKTTVDYTEPANVKRPDSWEDRVLSHGLIALQAHDAKSTVLYRKIRVKVLPD